MAIPDIYHHVLMPYNMIHAQLKGDGACIHKLTYLVSYTCTMLGVTDTCQLGMQEGKTPHKMLKDVGMAVPKIRACRQR